MNIRKIFMLAVLWQFPFLAIHAQQYNSDSWLSKPHGTITIIPTFGQRSSMLMNTYSLFPKWEFTMAAYMYNNDNDPKTDDGYSLSFFGKFMFYENKDRTGGAAIKAGTGLFPGVLKGDNGGNDAFKTYWMNMPVTLPLFKNKVSWDIMPGASMTKDYGDEEKTAFSFTYSTRIAWYPLNPETSIVGEVFGTVGETKSIPEYKIGLRWEPSQFAVFALTYGQEFNGTNGAGFEFGIMLFTPPFACLGGCGANKGKNKLFKRKPKPAPPSQ
ncbi:hypothetical protein KJS94_06155 [Flavihumibacter rivuli]|uniref:hypothetical protein n=1 Tax=Flavihumibacter rivuli TaxID=2838156 RepID=UPI001BDE4174|nr:hypothetical protein [Flavihumibacter rivuli]ULQ57779.1 hypothetical protein KJS94_06155 [Flavihumibacter rivuli]